MERTHWRERLSSGSASSRLRMDLTAHIFVVEARQQMVNIQMPAAPIHGVGEWMSSQAPVDDGLGSVP